MSRYFFDVHDGKSLPDAEGTELPDAGIARLQAVRMAGEIIRELNHMPIEDWRMSVREETGQVILSIWFSATEQRPGRDEARPSAPAP